VRDREHDGDLHGEQRQREVEGVLALPHPVRRIFTAAGDDDDEFAAIP